MGNRSTTPDDINTRTRRAVMDERKKKANRLDNNTFILNPTHPVKEGRKEGKVKRRKIEKKERRTEGR